MGMSRREDYFRHSRKVTQSRQWRGLRVEALRRDGWKCVTCGSRYRLEVDHIRPVRDRPDLAYDLANLQCPCGPCHARKTIAEVGLAPPTNPERQKWLALLRSG